MIKRKKYVANNNRKEWSEIDIQSDYLEDDPQKLDVLKVWEEDDNIDPLPKDEVSDLHRTRKTLTTGAYYLIILVVIGVFIYIVNIYNLRQLEKIKEDYGMDSKPPVPELWWQKAVFYNIVVRSYMDSNGDGIGDFQGIRQHLDHLLYIGIDAVILSRVLESPFYDFGLDVTNFSNVDPVYGSLQDFRDLVSDFHERGIKVLLEINPNHSGKTHSYFTHSRQKRKTYKDYYIWHNGLITANGTKSPPNNWVSRYGGSAWGWDEVRHQFYYHYYSHHTADFNYRNPHVVKHLQDVLFYWLQQNVDGFFLEGAHVLFEVDDLVLDEPLTEKEGVKPGDYESVQHVYTEDHSDIHDTMSTLREYIDNYAITHNKKLGILLMWLLGHSVILVLHKNNCLMSVLCRALLVNIEVSQLGDIMKYYETGANAPVCKYLTKLADRSGGREVWDIVDTFRMHLPDSREPVWMMSHIDNGFLSSAVGELYQNVLNMLMMLLPGAAVTYMGEELALTGLSANQLKDLHKSKSGRELQTLAVMSPLPWNSGTHAGFSKGSPWLPVRDSYHTDNIQAQREDHTNLAPIHLYGKLSRLRKETSFVIGEIQYALVNDHVFSFMRFAKNSAPYLIAVNVGHAESSCDFTLTAGVQYGKIVAYAKPVGAKAVRNLSYLEGRTIDLQKVNLYPGEGLVLLLLVDIVMDMNAF